MANADSPRVGALEKFLWTLSISPSRLEAGIVRSNLGKSVIYSAGQEGPFCWVKSGGFGQAVLGTVIRNVPKAL